MTLLCSNSTITKVYKQTDQTYKSVGGEINLISPTTLNLVCWFEETATYIRGIEGDSWQTTPTIIADYTENITEGDIISVLPKAYSGETRVEKLWRVEAITISTGLPFMNNSRVRNMELTLAPYKI